MRRFILIGAIDSPAPLTSEAGDELLVVDFIRATTSIPLDRIRVSRVCRRSGRDGRVWAARFGPDVVGAFRVYVSVKDDPSESAGSTILSDAPLIPMN